MGPLHSKLLSRRPQPCWTGKLDQKQDDQPLFFANLSVDDGVSRLAQNPNGLSRNLAMAIHVPNLAPLLNRRQPSLYGVVMPRTSSRQDRSLNGKRQEQDAFNHL